MKTELSLSKEHAVKLSIKGDSDKTTWEHQIRSMQNITTYKCKIVKLEVFFGNLTMLICQ